MNPMNTTSNPLMTGADLARLLSTSKAGVYQRLSRGQVPAAAIVRIGRTVRFDPAGVAAWLESLKG